MLLDALELADLDFLESDWVALASFLASLVFEDWAALLPPPPKNEPLNLPPIELKPTAVRSPPAAYAKL